MKHSTTTKNTNKYEKHAKFAKAKNPIFIDALAKTSTAYKKKVAETSQQSQLFLTNMP